MVVYNVIFKPQRNNKKSILQNSCKYFFIPVICNSQKFHLILQRILHKKFIIKCQFIKY